MRISDWSSDVCSSDLQETDGGNSMSFRRSLLGAPVLAAALAVAAAPSFAQVSDDIVRLGVLNDQSGLYADNTGPGSVLAARLASQDHGGQDRKSDVEGKHGTVRVDSSGRRTIK